MKLALLLPALCAAFFGAVGLTSAMAGVPSDAGIGQESSANVRPQYELGLVMSAHDKAVADDLVSHFSAQGFTCDIVQQGPMLWAILIRRPANPRDDDDGLRHEVEVYTQSKGAEFSGGGVNPVGAMRLHNSGQSFSPPQDVNMDGGDLTPAQLIFAGQAAMRQCFLPGQDSKQFFPCVSRAAAAKDAMPGSRQSYFAIGANFYASFAFDAAYEGLKQGGATADTLADLKKLALLNYNVWNGLCLNAHLSDEALGTALAADAEHDASGIAEVRKVRAVLEALQASSESAPPPITQNLASPNAKAVVIDGVTYSQGTRR